MTTGTGSRAAPAQRGPQSGGYASLPLIGKLESPLTTYYLTLGAMTTLVVFGLIMVFSASSVESMLDNQAAYSVFVKQLLFAVIGTAAVACAVRVPMRWWKRLSVPALVGSVGLQALIFVPSLGVEEKGNRNWLMIGSVQIQPSEFVKIGLILAGAAIFANKGALVGNWLHALVPFVIPISAMALALVLAGRDLGTGLVIGGTIFAVLLVAGAPKRLFAVGGLFVGAGVLALVTQSGNRTSRISNWLDPVCRTNPDGECGQTVHGLFALADGGWWGVGLGRSKEKWEWLPEGHNDFIFAIIGEELGLPGTLMILLLFALLAWACFRLITRTQDRFVRVATAGIMAWVLGQAIINIGSVIGLIPVVGVPLPLVSAGGSSLVTTMLALGIVLAFARNEPGCRALLAGRPSVIRRSLAVLPTKVTSGRAALGARRRSVRRRLTRKQ